MSNTSVNNKRIAKNTMLLYFRMLFMMVISLYTSRIVLNTLGVDDYGIYNVVGGVVSMFSILSGSLSAAISRFITFELGMNNIDKLKKIFSTSINVQMMLIVIIIILLESVGLWFLNNKMVISVDRLNAAYWVFQISIITFAINLWSIPYNACIIAHEKMSAFAYISIFDGIAKLGIAFLIRYNPIDRLVYYAILLMVTGVIQRMLYSFYCKSHFEECHYRMIFDKQITKEMFGFAGWNFIGSASAILRDQGGNIIINLFFGPTVNAARGIAMSVNSVVSGFVSNFMTALNPQITKNYAIGKYDYMLNLAFQGARFSYYILMLLALPIIFTAPYLLNFWLGIVPKHTSNFVCLVLLFTMSECLATPFITIMLATGKIRNYQLLVGGLQLLNLPLSYIFLKYGYPPEIIFIIAIVISIICEMARIVMLRFMIHLSIMKFLKDVYLNVGLVTILASIVPFFLLKVIEVKSLLSFMVIGVISFVAILVVIYFIGFSKQDRELVNGMIKKIVNIVKK